MALPIYVRAAKFNGATPIKILTGAPEQLNANLSVSGDALYLIAPTIVTVADVPPSDGLEQDPRFVDYP